MFITLYLLTQIYYFCTALLGAVNHSANLRFVMKCRTGIFIKKDSVQSLRKIATSRRNASCCTAAAPPARPPSSNGWSARVCVREYSSATPTSSLSGNIPSAVTNWSAMQLPTAWKPLMMNMITPLGWPLYVGWSPLLPPARLFLLPSRPLRQAGEHSRQSSGHFRSRSVLHRSLSVPRWSLSLHHRLLSVHLRSLSEHLQSLSVPHRPLSIIHRSLSLSKRLVPWFDKPLQSSNRTDL